MLTSYYKTSFKLLASVIVLAASNQLAAEPYFPPAGSWQQVKPQSLGVDTTKLQQAVDYAISSENPADKDQAIVQATTFGAREPYDQIIGPMSVCAGANGLIVYRGAVIANWGDTHSVDMTHSISNGGA